LDANPIPLRQQFAASTQGLSEVFYSPVWFDDAADAMAAKTKRIATVNMSVQMLVKPHTSEDSVAAIYAQSRSFSRLAKSGISAQNPSTGASMRYFANSRTDTISAQVILDGIQN
jgi:hypothetical protein